MARRTFIEAVDRNPWGDEIDESMLSDPGRDSTYIEGYSDVRTQRELAIRDGEPVTPLKHRLHLARGKTFDGQRADGHRISHWQTQKNYRPLSYDEAVKLGYRVDKNPAFHKGEDGLAWNGSNVLMIADAKTAATNLRRAQRDVVEQTHLAEQRMTDAVERFNRATPGAKAAAFSFVGDNDPDDIAKGKRPKK